jgi:hypothetical protein
MDPAAERVDLPFLFHVECVESARPGAGVIGLVAAVLDYGALGGSKSPAVQSVMAFSLSFG